MPRSLPRSDSQGVSGAQATGSAIGPVSTRLVSWASVPRHTEPLTLSSNSQAPGDSEEMVSPGSWIQQISCPEGKLHTRGTDSGLPCIETIERNNIWVHLYF